MAMDCARLRRRTLENSLTACKRIVSKLPGRGRGNTNIFVSELICRQVDGAVGAAADFLLNHILIYSMVSPAICFVIRELDTRVQCFLLISC